MIIATGIECSVTEILLKSRRFQNGRIKQIVAVIQGAL